jgi:hypothetical protein
VAWHKFSVKKWKRFTMTIQDFRLLPFAHKCDLVTYAAQFLLFRPIDDSKVFLYYLEDFFVEIYYSPKYQKVLMINAFDKIVGLEPYLMGVSLTDLMSRPAI